MSAKPRKKRSKPAASAEAKVAARLVSLARAKRRSSNEAVLAYTVCAEIGNSEYLPPQIGVIFRRDAEALLASPGKFPDGAASLVDPTQQEDAPFPTGTSYPYITIEAEAGEDWSWDAVEMEGRLRALVKAMNRLRKGDEPPFILVDLEDDTMRYLPDLDDRDRRAIEPFLGT